MSVAPVVEGADDVRKLPAPIGEHIFGAGWVALIHLLVHHTCIFESLYPLRSWRRRKIKGLLFQ